MYFVCTTYFGCNNWCHWQCTAIDCNSNQITAFCLYFGCNWAANICSVVTDQLDFWTIELATEKVAIVIGKSFFSFTKF